MKIRRQNVLVEPPSSATSDIAFILIIFFLVCASVQPDSGRAQTIPKIEETEDKQKQTKNLEIMLTDRAITINGQSVELKQFVTKLKQMLRGKTREGDKVVTLKSSDQVTYERWILINSLIEEGGGIVSIQMEKERTVIVD